MPYTWSNTPTGQTLQLWPHRSLPRKGFAAIILMAFCLAILPLLALLGSILLWVMLPFILIMLAALWWALDRSYQSAKVSEELIFDGHDVVLTHSPLKGQDLVWRCNVHWVRVELHPHQGPVPNYLTLTGNARPVELGRFLSEDERKVLWSEVEKAVQQAQRPHFP